MSEQLKQWHEAEEKYLETNRRICKIQAKRLHSPKWPVDCCPMAMDDTRTIRLLVVEDNRAYLHLIQRAFRGRKEQIRWELTVAEDGEQALHLLFEEEAESAPLPDLILLDWNLPKVSGDEVLRRIKEHRKLRRIPVLVFSSSEADEDIHAAYDYHANGYITKPNGVDALAVIVETIERFWIAVAQLPKVVR